MKKIFLMFLLSITIFANWKVENNTAYVTDNNCTFKYQTTGDPMLSGFTLIIPANGHQKEVMRANQSNLYIYIADTKDPDNGVGIGSASKNSFDDIFSLVSWNTTINGIEASFQESSPYFKDVDKILKKSSSILIEIFSYSETTENSEDFYSSSFSSVGYTKAKQAAEKNASMMFK